MLITPEFSVEQTDDWVDIHIRMPYRRAKDIDYCVEDDLLPGSGTSRVRVYSKPYFLRLTLPGVVVVDGREKAHYDIDAGMLKLHLPKLHPGSHFPNLDMLTALLAKTSTAPSPAPVIESLDSAPPDPDADYNWELDQQLPTTTDDPPTTSSSSSSSSSSVAPGASIRYGFNDMFADFFPGFQVELSEVVDIPDPDHIQPELRHPLRLSKEARDFSLDHYMADYMDDEPIRDILAQPALWWELDSAAAAQSSIEFTADEKQVLISQLRNRDYLFADVEAERSALLALVDLVYAYAYDHRTTYGEPTVESAWTVCKLSATLSWFVKWTNLRHTAIGSVRRALVYPLFRHWQLSMRVLDDTTRILTLGRRAILKCLLGMRVQLEKSDQRYHLNRLYIDHYCVWIQTVAHSKLALLPRGLKWLQLQQAEVGWPLHTFEALARDIDPADQDEQPHRVADD